MLEKLGGGCQVPIRWVRFPRKGHYPDARDCRVAGWEARYQRGRLSGVDPLRTGASLGRNLLEKGAEEILRAIA